MLTWAHALVHASMEEDAPATLKMAIDDVSWELFQKRCTLYVILALKEKWVEKGLEHLPVVRDFADVFPEELPGMPPERELEFTVDLKLGTEPIARTPYRMSKPELQELRMQLKELLDLGLIHPSVSSWLHMLFSYERRMGHGGSTLTIVSWTRQRSRTSIHFQGLMIYSIKWRARWCSQISTCDQDNTSYGLRRMTSLIPPLRWGLDITSLLFYCFIVFTCWRLMFALKFYCDWIHVNSHALQVIECPWVAVKFVTVFFCYWSHFCSLNVDWNADWMLTVAVKFVTMFFCFKDHEFPPEDDCVLLFKVYVFSK